MTPSDARADSAPTGEVGVGLIGLGTVGVGVVQLLERHADLYAQRLGRPVTLRRVLVRDAARPREGVTLSGGVVTDDAEAFFATPGLDVVVEVAGGVEPMAGYVRRALEAGSHVVTANKALLAERGPELFALARERGVSIAMEASCAGGIPIITSLLGGLMSNEVTGLFGILNGTCNYILTAMSVEGSGYDAALRDAQDKGFAEADPTMDVSGQDAAQKLTILASLAFGRRCDPGRVLREGIEAIASDDIRYGAELGYDVKLLAIAQRVEGGELSLRVHPCFVASSSMLAHVRGAQNAVAVAGDAVGQTMLIGPGAGMAPTASAVVADLLNVASGGYATQFRNTRLTPDCVEPAKMVDPESVRERVYLRLAAMDAPGTLSRIATVLGEAGISLSGVLQHEAKAGQFVPLVIVTHEATEGAVRHATATLRELDCIDGDPVVIRIVDLPA